ncbi:MAG: hypothetical protein RIS79_1862 [Verrucomicrobiota bacterium]
MRVFHPFSPSHAPETSVLVSHLQGMVEELRRTRESFLGQMDAQIARASGLLKVLDAAPPAAQGALPPLHPPNQEMLQPPPKLTSVVLSSQEQAGIDPHLEEATLAELNAALSQAFTEIANRGGLLAR